MSLEFIKPRRLMNQTRGAEIVSDVRLAVSFGERTIGLMGKKTMNPNSTLWIQGSRFIPCNSIHTCFMRFAIDVVFVDRNLKVRAVFKDLSPWRMTRVVVGAQSVFEFAAGTLARSPIEVGDQLHVGA